MQHVGRFELRRVRQVERTFDSLEAASLVDVAIVYGCCFEKDIVEQRLFAGLDRGYEGVSRAAIFIDKIFKGSKPGEIPIEQATKFEFVLNLRAAKTLGFEVPTPILLRADETPSR